MTKSELDDVDGRNNQFHIGKKCGNFVDAVIKLQDCIKTVGKDFTIMAEVRNG